MRAYPERIRFRLCKFLMILKLSPRFLSPTSVIPWQLPIGLSFHIDLGFYDKRLRLRQFKEARAFKPWQNFSIPLSPML